MRGLAVRLAAAVIVAAIPAIADAAEVVGTATSAVTSTPAESLEVPAEELDASIAEAPLTDEELALLRSLDVPTATTSTSAQAIEARWWLVPPPLARPTVLLPRALMHQSLGRSVAECFEPYPTIVD